MEKCANSSALDKWEKNNEDNSNKYNEFIEEVKRELLEDFIELEDKFKEIQLSYEYDKTSFADFLSEEI